MPHVIVLTSEGYFYLYGIDLEKGVASLALNSTSTLLATSSEKGTVIRVWSVPGAEKLYQFHRGTREVRIWSMNFNLVGSLLAVSSERGTVHVFRLGSGQQGGGHGGVKAVGAAASPSSSPTASGKGWDGASSLPDSVDGTTQGLDGGYDAFIEKKKSANVSCVLFLSYYYCSIRVY